MDIKNKLSFIALSASVLLSCNHNKTDSSSSDANKEDILITVADSGTIEAEEHCAPPCVEEIEENKAGKVEIDTRYFRDLEFEDYNYGIKNTMKDTVLNGRYIKYGTARSNAREHFLNISDLDSYFVAPSGDTIPETCLDGYVACMMVDPKDGRDMIFVDRNMLIDSLHIRGEASYMGSRIDVMYVGIDKSSDAVRIINDTVVFKAYLIIMDTDISSVINLKVLKDRDTTRLWVEDISDQIVMGDD